MIKLNEIFKQQNPQDGSLPNWAKEFALECCRQTLELAAENATAKIEIEWSGNTGSEYCDEDAVVNKQSILDIIKQIE